jgi:hypothetical protein
MQRGNNNTNHLVCFNCESPRYVDALVHTLQGWRVVCVNCASTPGHEQWLWRCYVNNCVRPVIKENYIYCACHQMMYNAY